MDVAKKRTNVLQVMHSPGVGGLESLVADLCRNINREKYCVSVLCVQGGDQDYLNEIKKIGVPVFLISKKNRFDFSFFSKIVRLLKQEKIDLVHAHSGCFFNIAICAFFARIKRTIFTVHGMPIATNLQAKIEDKIAASLFGRLVAVSEEIQDYLKETFPHQNEKVMLIMNGVDTILFSKIKERKILLATKKKYEIPIDKKIIGGVGRLEKEKNYAMLIHAVSLLVRNKFNDIHIVLIGNGTEREALESLADRLNMRENISFLGIQNKIHEILPIFDIDVLPSFTEGTSLSLLEAQSCGIPSIATNVGGNVSIIENGYNGFLCKIDNPAELADKIKNLIHDTTLLEQMGSNARDVVLKRYNLASMIRSYERTYEFMLEA